MNVITVEELREMMICVCDSVAAEERRLCELDSFVGDGDHGVTAARGFRAVKKVLESKQYQSVEELLEEAAETLSETMGGAIGPIFGSIFEGAAESAAGRSRLTAVELGEMLEQGLKEVKMIGGAKEGDRTLVDCLAPAVCALKEAAGAGADLSEALMRAADAGAEGVEATKKMVAKKGRAKFLQEKSLGHQDAGATSMWIVLKAMSDYCAGK